MADARYPADALVAFADSLLQMSGVRADIARAVADALVTGDLLGHTTHGLALLAPYLAEIEKGTMTKAGEPTVINSRPALRDLGRPAAARTMAHDCGRWTTRRRWRRRMAPAPS